MMPGWTEIVVILVIVLLLFGPQKLPELARSVGQSFKEIKRGMNDVKEEAESNLEQEDSLPSDDD